MSERAVNGDFHVIRMDGLFHVVFRPDADPEWFRIIASFYTYERAWSYCDIERVTAMEEWDAEHPDWNVETAQEEHGGLRSPPVQIQIKSALSDPEDLPFLIRDVYGGSRDEPLPAELPVEDFRDHPHENEAPKDYHRRVHEEAAAAICRAADDLPPEPRPADDDPDDPMAEAVRELSDAQWSVLKYFRDNVDDTGSIRVSLKKIAVASGVPASNTTFLIEALERKGFLTIMERGDSKNATLYHLNTAEEKEAAGDDLRCATCGGPRSVHAVSQCQKCYQGEAANA